MSEIKVVNTFHGGGAALSIDGTISTPFEAHIFESRAELQTDSVGGDNFFDVEVYDRAASDKVMQHRFSDLSREIKRIVLSPSSNLIRGETEISLGVAIRRGFVGVRGGYAGRTHIALNFHFNPNDWKRLWSIREYQREFKHTFDEQNLPDVQWTPEEARFDVEVNQHDRMSLSFVVGDTDATIEAEARKHSGVLSRLHELTVESLMSKLRQESVVMHFDFPEEFKVPCEQYLLYFVQFLKDLGVGATAELRHEAEKVLFAVTPKDKETALDKIRAALETYLQLPSALSADAVPLEYEIAVQRLAANIDHLKGQVRLNHAELRLANATIQTQQVTIERLLRPIEEDREQLLGGTVALTKFKWKGVEFNLPEILRRLRRMFRRREDKEGGEDEEE